MNFCACDSTKPILLIGVSHRVATVSDERRTASPQMVTTSNFIVTPRYGNAWRQPEWRFARHREYMTWYPTGGRALKQLQQMLLVALTSFLPVRLCSYTWRQAGSHLHARPHPSVQTLRDLSNTLRQGNGSKQCSRWGEASTLGYNSLGNCSCLTICRLYHKLGTWAQSPIKLVELLHCIIYTLHNYCHPLHRISTWRNIRYSFA